MQDQRAGICHHRVDLVTGQQRGAVFADDVGQFGGDLLAVDGVLDDPVVDAAESVEPGIAVFDIAMRGFAGRRIDGEIGRVVEVVVEGNGIGPAREIGLDRGAVAVVVADRQHRLDEAVEPRVLAVGQALGEFHRPAQFGQEADHVGHRRAAVDAQRATLEIDLAGVAGGAGIAGIILAAIGFAGKAHRQGVGIEQGAGLRQVAVPVDVSIAQEPGRRFAVALAFDAVVQAGLLKGEQEIIGQQRRPLRRGVEPQAVRGIPALIEIFRHGVGFAECTVGDRGGAAGGIAVPALVDTGADNAGEWRGDQEHQQADQRPFRFVGQKQDDTKQQPADHEQLLTRTREGAVQRRSPC